MGSNLKTIIHNSVRIQWKRFAVDSIEVTSFTEIEVDNPESIDIRLCNVNGDVYVVARWKDEHLELIDSLGDIESVLIEEDELLDEPIFCLVTPVHNNYSGVLPALSFIFLYFCFLFPFSFFFSFVFLYFILIFFCIPFLIFDFPFSFLYSLLYFCILF